LVSGLPGFVVDVQLGVATVFVRCEFAHSGKTATVNPFLLCHKYTSCPNYESTYYNQQYTTRNHRS
jgi:hypothetical protein